MWNFLKDATAKAGVLDTLQASVRGLDDSLREASASRPSSARPSSARFLLDAATVATSSLRNMVDRGTEREALPLASREELELPLLASQLSDLPYDFATAGPLAEEAKKIVPHCRMLWHQPQHQGHNYACWYLLEGQIDGSDALVLVFRGTHSAQDVLTDLFVKAEDGPSGGRFHAGFLATVRDDVTLQAQLRQHATGTRPVYLFGHSLGGALAETLFAAELLPPAHTGPVTCINLGGPKVALCMPTTRRPRASERLIVVVHGNDPIPRLLGSPAPIVRAAVGWLDNRSSRTSRSSGTSYTSWIDHCSDYFHPPIAEVLFVDGECARRVPVVSHNSVFHVFEGITGLFSGSIEQHKIYSEVLERSWMALC